MVAYLFMGLKGIFLCIVKCSVKLLLYSAIVGRQGAVSCAVALEWRIITIRAPIGANNQYICFMIQLTQLVVLDGASKDAQNPSFTLFFFLFFLD